MESVPVNGKGKENNHPLPSSCLCFCVFQFIVLVSISDKQLVLMKKLYTTFQKEISNISLFQLLKCNLLLALHHTKVILHIGLANCNVTFN